MKATIALFCASLRGGGAERVMVNLAHGIAERGVAVDLVLARAEGPYLKEVHPDVTIVDLRARRVLTSLPGLIRYLRRRRPRAMLSATDHVNVVALLAAKLAGVKTRLVPSVHSFRDEQSMLTIRDQLIHRVLLRITYSWAETVVAVSGGVKKLLLEKTGLSSKRISVVYNPVVTPEISAKANSRLNHPWFAPGEPPIIVSAGRLDRQKDFSTLIHAFSITRQTQRCRLAILGEGPQRAGLEALIKTLKLETDVGLLGFVDNPYAHMRRASCFALSSAWEGFGNVLVEAMAVGCPVVSTNCMAGPAEILDNGRYGRLVPVGDVKALADAILATLEAPADADTLRARASMFSLKYITDQYLDVLLDEAGADQAEGAKQALSESA